MYLVCTIRTYVVLGIQGVCAYCLELAGCSCFRGVFLSTRLPDDKMSKHAKYNYSGRNIWTLPATPTLSNTWLASYHPVCCLCIGVGFRVAPASKHGFPVIVSCSVRASLPKTRSDPQLLTRPLLARGPMLLYRNWARCSIRRSSRPRVFFMQLAGVRRP